MIPPPRHHHRISVRGELEYLDGGVRRCNPFEEERTVDPEQANVVLYARTDRLGQRGPVEVDLRCSVQPDRVLWVTIAIEPAEGWAFDLDRERVAATSTVVAANTTASFSVTFLGERGSQVTVRGRIRNSTDSRSA